MRIHPTGPGADHLQMLLDTGNAGKRSVKRCRERNERFGKNLKMQPFWEATSEKALTETARGLAKFAKGLRYHTFNSKHSEAGFPDEFLLWPDRIVTAELKTEDNEPTIVQIKWLQMMARFGEMLDNLRDEVLMGTGILKAPVPSLEVYLWWPSDVDEMKAVLVGA